MKITIDKESEATYVKLTSEKIVKSVEQEPYVIDYDKDGNIVGIEWLSARVELDVE
jgi:uncharacterized protein YuzE